MATITDRFEPICMVMTTDGPVSFVVTLSPLTELFHDPRRDELQIVEIMQVEHLKSTFGGGARVARRCG